MHRTHVRQLALALAAGVSLILAAVVPAAALQSDSDAEHRVCFSAAAWSADDADRPCWGVSVEEDGSGRLETAQAVCTVPAFDSRRDRVRCH